MKPSRTAYATKKKPAKRKNSPLVQKLLELKYRLRAAYHDRDIDTKDDKRYVMSLITDIRKHKFTKLAPEDGYCCNGLWRKYAG